MLPMLADSGGFPCWLSMLAMQFFWLCWLSYTSWLDINADYSCYVGFLY
jgi:hypothetical protein